MSLFIYSPIPTHSVRVAKIYNMLMVNGTYTEVYLYCIVNLYKVMTVIYILDAVPVCVNKTTTYKCMR